MGAHSRKAPVLLLGAASILVPMVSGCETGFGQPCSLPKTEEIRAACNPAEVDREDDDDIIRESSASCALKNYAGCETRVCLVYRGSDPFCSETCQSDGDCEGSAVCRPLLGDPVDQNSDGTLDNCVDDGSGVPSDCFCVKSGAAN